MTPKPRDAVEPQRCPNLHGPMTPTRDEDGRRRWECDTCHHVFQGGKAPEVIDELRQVLEQSKEAEEQT